MELWTEVRRRVLTGELSRREAAREYGLNYRTVAKACEHVEPPGYRRASPQTRPKMEPFLPRIAEILEANKRAPKKQRHTARRTFDRLREEHGYDGCYESAKEAVREWSRGNQEVFLPLSHPSGEAQFDFGYAYVDLDGERGQVALFVMTPPTAHSWKEVDHEDRDQEHRARKAPPQAAQAANDAQRVLEAGGPLGERQPRLPGVPPRALRAGAGRP